MNEVSSQTYQQVKNTSDAICTVAKEHGHFIRAHQPINILI